MINNLLCERIFITLASSSKAFSLKRLFAFTLAETLIVMGIIGVVAALTIPNLNSSTNDKEKVAKVMKIYSNLEDAYGRATSVYGPVDEWFQNDSTVSAQSTRFGERMLDFMKPTKVCKIDVGCFSGNPLLYVNGTASESNFVNSLKSEMDYMAILSDGTSIAFSAAYSNMLKIRVDIDGMNKGKNTVGVDVFGFTIPNFDDTYGDKKGELIPSIRPYKWTGNVNGGITDNATAWIVKNGNMDYLKADTSGKCPDGNYLNWETKTSCK